MRVSWGQLAAAALVAIVAAGLHVLPDRLLGPDTRVQAIHATTPHRLAPVQAAPPVRKLAPQTATSRRSVVPTQVTVSHVAVTHRAAVARANPSSAPVAHATKPVAVTAQARIVSSPRRAAIRRILVRTATKRHAVSKPVRRTARARPAPTVAIDAPALADTLAGSQAAIKAAAAAQTPAAVADDTPSDDAQGHGHHFRFTR